MRQFRKRFAMIVTAALLGLGLALPAQAGLIHSLSTNFGSGQIAFLDPSGNDSSGVAAFAFDVDVPTLSVTFGLADIDEITWFIDPNTWALSINLTTVLRDLVGGEAAAIALSNTTGSTNDLSCPTGGSISGPRAILLLCRASMGSIGTGFSALEATPAKLIAPSGLAIFLLGLAGLGAGLRRPPA